MSAPTEADSPIVAGFAGSRPRPPGIRAAVAASTRHWFTTDVILPVVATRLMLIVIGLLAIALLPRSMDPGKWEFSHSPLVNMWSRWDAGWYLGIALDGYTYHPGEFTRVCFYPLYPMLMRGAAYLMGRNDPEGFLIAGILVSNLALLVAVAFLVLLVRAEFDRPTAVRAGIYLLVFPTSLFLSAVYPESLFLALAIPSFYYARRSKWWVAGILAGLAVLTRPLGCLLLIPLGYEFITQRGSHWRTLVSGALRLAPIPLFWLGWCAFLFWRFGDPWLSAKAQIAWGHHLSLPWESLIAWFNAPSVVHGPEHSVFDLLFTVFLGVGVVGTWYKTRPTYALVATVVVLGALSSGSLMSITRYSLEAFPVFIVLALWGRQEWFERIYLVTATSLGSLFMALFALWYWAA